MLDLRRLRYFVAVAETRSFSRAAERLLIAQSAVSRQVGLFERELGVRLLDRSTHDVQLTAAGASLLERGKVLLGDADALWAATRDFAEGTRGQLTVGYSTSTGYETAPALLRTVREVLPTVTISAVVMPSVELAAAVAGRRVTLALVRSPVGHQALSRTVIRRERLRVLIRADHAWSAMPEVELRDLEGELLVLHDRSANPNHFDLVVGACRAAGFEPRVMSWAAPFDPSFGVVTEGKAIAIVGESATHGLPAGLVSVPLATAARVDIALLARRDEQAPHVLLTHAEIVEAAKANGWISPATESP